MASSLDRVIKGIGELKIVGVSESCATELKELDLSIEHATQCVEAGHALAGGGSALLEKPAAALPDGALPVCETYWPFNSVSEKAKPIGKGEYHRLVSYM